MSSRKNQRKKTNSPEVAKASMTMKQRVENVEGIVTGLVTVADVEKTGRELLRAEVSEFQAVTQTVSDRIAQVDTDLSAQIGNMVINMTKLENQLASEKGERVNLNIRHTDVYDRLRNYESTIELLSERSTRHQEDIRALEKRLDSPSWWQFWK